MFNCAVTSKSHFPTRNHLVQPISPEIHQMAVEVTMTSTDDKEENILSACDAQESFDIDEETFTDSKLRIFTYYELCLATMNFHPDKALGEGGFGTVYKGWIDVFEPIEAQISTNNVVAVKILNQKGMQGHREWLVWFLITYFHLFYLVLKNDLYDFSSLLFELTMRKLAFPSLCLRQKLKS